MAIADIQSWLDGDRDFSKGKSIYMRIGGDDLLKKQLGMVETSFLRRKLLNALVGMNDDAKRKLKEKIAVEQSRVLEPEREPVVMSQKITPKPKINYDGLPPVLKDRFMEKKKLWALINQCLYALVPGQVERNAKLIKKIKKLDTEIDGIWKELDYYHHTGELLIGEDERDKPKHVLHQELLNARSNVSRYKGKKDKEKLFKKWSDKVDRLTELLDGSI